MFIIASFYFLIAYTNTNANTLFANKILKVGIHSKAVLIGEPYGKVRVFHADTDNRRYSPTKVCLGVVLCIYGLFLAVRTSVFG